MGAILDGWKPFLVVVEISQEDESINSMILRKPKTLEELSSISHRSAQNFSPYFLIATKSSKMTFATGERYSGKTKGVLMPEESTPPP